MVFAIMQCCALCYHHPDQSAVTPPPLWCLRGVTMVCWANLHCTNLLQEKQGNESGCLWVSYHVSNKHCHMHSYIFKSHHVKHIFGHKRLHSGWVANSAICYGSWVTTYIYPCVFKFLVIQKKCSHLFNYFNHIYSKLWCVRSLCVQITIEPALHIHFRYSHVGVLVKTFWC